MDDAVSLPRPRRRLLAAAMLALTLLALLSPLLLAATTMDAMDVSPRPPTPSLASSPSSSTSAVVAATRPLVLDAMHPAAVESGAVSAASICRLRSTAPPLNLTALHDTGSRVQAQQLANRLVDLCHRGRPRRGGSGAAADADAFMLTARFAAAGPASRELYLSTCYPVEIVAPQDHRSMGQCADFALYIVYAGARLSDQYDAATLREKARRCPRSTFLHGEHAIEPLFAAAAAQDPPALRNAWMPNLEQIQKTQEPLLLQAGVLLAKNMITADVLRDVLDSRTGRGGRRPEVRFMAHSTPDPTVDAAPDALAALYYADGDAEAAAAAEAAAVAESLQRLHLPPDGAVDYTRVLHAFGVSPRKHTVEVVECWLRNPNWPPLTVVGNLGRAAPDGSLIAHVLRHLTRPLPTHPPGTPEPGANIAVVPFLPSPAAFRAVARAHGVHLCPSNQEGFGHYLDAARALSAVVLATAHAPMADFASPPGRAGLLVPHADPPAPEAYQLVTDKFVPGVHVDADHVCAAVERDLLPMRDQDRRRMGRAARRGYERDQGLMGSLLLDLRREAVAGLLLGHGHAADPVWPADVPASDGDLQAFFDRLDSSLMEQCMDLV
ncbi:hypothetical protein HK405_011331 [Cladochytrium tenue]|nr:hypothetical protein HK405_011331 [Cladochytrium tenue]